MHLVLYLTFIFAQDDTVELTCKKKVQDFLFKARISC